MIAVVDYGMGNLRSVLNALAAVGAPALVAGDPAKLREASGIVLPGVGAFGDGMRQLRERGFVEALEEAVRQRGKPFLGICLGMQLLAEAGTEQGEHAGLGWVAGRVVRLAGRRPDGARLRVPHVGWNDVTAPGPSALFGGPGCAGSFYFVHSYVLVPDDPALVSGTCEYGQTFAAGIEAGHIFGTQFHPEKSHRAGLALLGRFARLAAACAAPC